MNLTDDCVLKFQCGSPLLFEDICAIKSHTLREIVELGYGNFQKYLQIVLVEKPVLDRNGDEEVAKLIDELSTFQYLLLMTQLDGDISRTAREAFKFFTGDDVLFVAEDSKIVFGDVSENRTMNEEQFHEFRRVLKRAYFIEVDEEEVIFYANDSEMVRRMKKQRLRNREMLRRAKAKKAQQSGEGTMELSDLIASLTFGGCNLNMSNIWDITYYSFRDQLKRMGWHEKFDINNRAALAGAKLKKSQLKHWIKAISCDDKD